MWSIFYLMQYKSRFPLLWDFQHQLHQYQRLLLEQQISFSQVPLRHCSIGQGNLTTCASALTSQLGQLLPPLLVRGGIPFEGLASLFVCWLLILVLTNVRQVHVVDFFPLYRFTRIQNDTLASVRNLHRTCQSLFCPRPSQKTEAQVFHLFFPLKHP